MAILDGMKNSTTCQELAPLLEGPKLTPDAGTVPIGPRGTVRFLKQDDMYVLRITACGKTILDTIFQN